MWEIFPPGGGGYRRGYLNFLIDLCKSHEWTWRYEGFQAPWLCHCAYDSLMSCVMCNELYQCVRIRSYKS